MIPKTKKFGRLKHDTYRFFKDTEFEILSEDDGFWSNNPFYQTTINGRYETFEWGDVEIIKSDDYNRKILEKPIDINNKTEEWWEYTNYP